jgi:hypothetical protein
MRNKYGTTLEDNNTGDYLAFTGRLMDAILTSKTTKSLKLWRRGGGSEDTSKSKGKFTDPETGENYNIHKNNKRW